MICIFSGSGKKQYFKNWLLGNFPDSPIFGYNFFLTSGFNVKLADFSYDFSFKLENFIRKYFGFNFIFLFYFFSIINSDVVFSSSALHMIILTKPFDFFWKKKKWYFLNINLSNLIRRNFGIKRRIILKSLNMCKRIICLSEQQKNDLLNFGVDKNKISVVKFGVDKNFFKGKVSDIPLNKYILSVGRDNGRDYKTLVDSLGETKYNVIIVCSERNLKNIIIPSNFKIIYDADYIKLRSLYFNSKMVIVPSRNEDSFWDGSDCSGQTVILDAFASSRPVLATHRKWMNDYFENEKDIFIVPPENSFLIRKKVDEVFNDDKLLMDVARNARIRIDKDLNTEHMSKEIIKIINKN